MGACPVQKSMKHQRLALLLSPSKGKWSRKFFLQEVAVGVGNQVRPTLLPGSQWDQNKILLKWWTKPIKFSLGKWGHVVYSERASLSSPDSAPDTQELYILWLLISSMAVWILELYRCSEASLCCIHTINLILRCNVSMKHHCNLKYTNMLFFQISTVSGIQLL